MKYKWCEQNPIHQAELGCVSKKPPKVARLRCPKCKKRFLPIIKDCGDFPHTGCWHVYLPPHKKRVT